jgi:hypothetical protein
VLADTVVSVAADGCVVVYSGAGSGGAVVGTDVASAGVVVAGGGEATVGGLVLGVPLSTATPMTASAMTLAAT